MKHIVMGASALLLSAPVAMAAGLDRSGQGIDAIFETGTYAELSFGVINPDQDGTFMGAVKSGDINPSYNQVGGAFKWDLSPQVSMAIIYDQPFGAKIEYPTGTRYPLSGTTAEVTTNSITALMRYKFNDNFSVHGGLRYISVKDEIRLYQGGALAYSLSGDQASGFGYVIGAAYEKPEIALRAAITYSSKVDIDQDVTVGGALNTKISYTLPQSVNIDLQTGVAPGTLVFANIRWVDWTALEINAPGYPGNPLVGYDNDGWSYKIGVARQFNEKFAGSLSIGYEPSHGGLATNLSPSDGVVSLSVGGKYQVTEQMAISGGVTFQRRGDATTETIAAKFEDNTLMGVGLKISYSF